jgi:hypothetical protein
MFYWDLDHIQARASDLVYLEKLSSESSGLQSKN